ncbi:MAG: SDR family oxidoreductase [Flavobacteriales bacterium]|nr:SDR family oxidoreductase [Flavobacteriales bacterium]
MTKRTRILITGGTGYLGGRISEYLNEIEEFEVTIASRNPKNNKVIKVIEAHQNTPNLEKIIKDFDVVIHLAAVDAPTCQNEIEQAINVNIIGTTKWIEASKKAGVSNFIYFSTIHVYGNQPNILFINEETCTKPNHPYSITHKAAEDFVLTNSSGNFKTYVFRLSNAVGYPARKMTQWHLLVPDICQNLVKKNVFYLKSNPATARDFISIKSVCKTVKSFITKKNNIDSGVYNISSGINTEIGELTNQIVKLYNQTYSKNAEVIFQTPYSALSKFPEIVNEKTKNLGIPLESDLNEEILGLLQYCIEND